MVEQDNYIPVEMSNHNNNIESQQNHSMRYRAKIGGFSGFALGIVTSTLSESLNAVQGDGFKFNHISQGALICGVVGSIAATYLPSLYNMIPPENAPGLQNEDISLLASEEGYANKISYQNSGLSGREK